MLLVQNWSLGRLAALLQQAELYIGNDSGITHLAAACGVKTIALFGPTDPRIWAPQGWNLKIIRWQPETLTEAPSRAPPHTSTAEPPQARVVLEQAKYWLGLPGEKG